MAQIKRRLEDLISVGPAMLRDFEMLEIRSMGDLASANPRKMYGRLCDLTGERQDPCVLDVFAQRWRKQTILVCRRKMPVVVLEPQSKGNRWQTLSVRVRSLFPTCAAQPVSRAADARISGEPAARIAASARLGRSFAAADLLFTGKIVEERPLREVDGVEAAAGPERRVLATTAKGRAALAARSSVKIGPRSASGRRFLPGWRFPGKPRLERCGGKSCVAKSFLHRNWRGKRRPCGTFCKKSGTRITRRCGCYGWRSSSTTPNSHGSTKSNPNCRSVRRRGTPPTFLLREAEPSGRHECRWRTSCAPCGLARGGN